MTSADLKAEIRYLRQKARMLDRACAAAVKGKTTALEALKIEDACTDISKSWTRLKRKLK